MRAMPACDDYEVTIALDTLVEARAGGWRVWLPHDRRRLRRNHGQPGPFGVVDAFTRDVTVLPGTNLEPGSTFVRWSAALQSSRDE
jgi:hypothetical protein